MGVLEETHSIAIPLYWVTWKVASFEWGLEQGRALWRVQAVIQTVLLLGLFNPAEPRVLEVSVTGKDAVMANPSRRVMISSLGIMKRGYANGSEEKHF